MGKISKSYLKEYFIFLFLIFLFFNFSFSFVSATAQFNDIPLQQMGFNTYHEINLRDYCSSNQTGNYCRDSSFGVQFINPDNQQQITLLGSGENDNSYFTITLINGLVQIQAKQKVLDTQIIIYGADVEYSSQVSTSFIFDIVESNSPQQIASFLPPVLYGNGSVTYNMNDFFLNFDSIRVNYNDDLLNQTINLQLSKNEAAAIQSGRLRIILTSTTSDILLTIQGLNQTYNASSSGGNLFFVTAINPYGQVTTKFPVITYKQLGFQTYSALPIRNPISIAPIYLKNQNQTINYNLSSIYKNVTYFNVSWDTNTTGVIPYKFNETIFNNSRGWITLYVNGTQTVYDYTVGSWSTNTEDANAPGLYGAQLNNIPVLKINGINPFDFVQFRTSLGNYSSQVFSATFGIPGFQIVLNLSGCNNIGCVNTDAFGNVDNLYINYSSKPPEAVPLSFEPIVMGYGQFSIFNFDDMFSNYDYLILNWSEGGQNFSVITPAIADLFNKTTYVSGGVPIYQTRLYYNNLFSVVSGNQDHNFTIYPLACNSVSCIDGTLGVPQSLTFIIQGDGFSNVQVSSDFFKNLFNVIFGLFPDSDTLSSVAKANYVLITVALIFGMIMLFGFKTGSGMISLVIFGLLVSFFVVVFFTFKGYLSPVVIAVPIMIGLIAFILQFAGGRN